MKQCNSHTVSKYWFLFNYNFSCFCFESTLKLYFVARLYQTALCGPVFIVTLCPHDLHTVGCLKGRPQGNLALLYNLMEHLTPRCKNDIWLKPVQPVLYGEEEYIFFCPHLVWYWHINKSRNSNILFQLQTQSQSSSADFLSAECSHCNKSPLSRKALNWRKICQRGLTQKTHSHNWINLSTQNSQIVWMCTGMHTRTHNFLQQKTFVFSWEALISARTTHTQSHWPGLIQLCRPWKRADVAWSENGFSYKQKIMTEEENKEGYWCRDRIMCSICKANVELPPKTKLIMWSDGTHTVWTLIGRLKRGPPHLY